MNVSGAIAAVLLDAGYPLLAVKGVPMLARTASLIAHLHRGAAAAHRLRARRLGRQRHRLRRPAARRLRAGRRLSGTRMALQPVLRGVKIVEQGTFITGPCAGMMLADLGADVIKIESPGGDPYRAYQGGLYSPHFQAYNRNKRSIVCDLKQAADRELFERLIGEADVYIQNFRPGTAEKLGAGPARLRELNPRLVYCSISGFGASGPYVERPELRLGGAGAVRFPERGGRRGPAAFPRAGAGRCHHRHLRGLRRAGRAARTRQHRPRQAGRSVHARSHGAFRRRAVRGVLRARHRAEVLGPAAPRAGLHPAHRRRRSSSRSICRRWRNSGWDWSRRWTPTNSRATRASASAWRASPTTRRWARSSTSRFRAPHAAGVVRAAECERRAVRAHQRHRRGGRGSAGRTPGTHRAGERRAAGRTRGGASGAAVRRRARARGERRAAARPAWRGDPRGGERQPALAGGHDGAAPRRATG